MSSPYVRVNSERQIIGVSSDEAVRRSSSEIQDRVVSGSNASKNPSSVIADEAFGTPVPVGGGVTGVIDITDDTDFYTVSLVAGQTYSLSMRGAGTTPLNDPLLVLYSPAGTFIEYDDDGGNGIDSFMTFTATEPGTYYLGAFSFANGDAGTGEYALDVRQQTVDSVGATNATAAALNMGVTFGFRETGSDVDRYAIYLEAGEFYTFEVAGSADYENDYLDLPAGTLDTILQPRDANGNLVSSADDNNFPSDISSGIAFAAQSTGWYYLDVTAYPGQTGGYVLETATVDLSTADPLDSLRWVDAADIPTVIDPDTGQPTAYVYFAPAGVNYGELADDGETLMTTFGWQPHEITAVMSALAQYTPITGINYEITQVESQATFRLLTTSSDEYGAYAYPRDPAYGTQQSILVFNVDSGGWSLPESLEPGGYSYAVILHEFGHAHGIAHPHDTGGGSDVMAGVFGAGTFGFYDLNQGVYTVMSYNDAWQKHPDGPSDFTARTIDDGWSASLSAFDIAVLQERYGVHAANTGNDVYQLSGKSTDAAYRTIWDTAGNDTIAYSGRLHAQIDLTAATLDYTGDGRWCFVIRYQPPGQHAAGQRRLHYRGWRGDRECDRRSRQRRLDRQPCRQCADRQRRQRQPVWPRRQ
jgi:hypothetical protein